MNKPGWVGDETPDIAAIRAGREWGDLDSESWQRIEAIVAARPESVRHGDAVIHGTHRQLWKARQRALWEARRATVDDPANGIVGWTGRDGEPERQSVQRHRDATGSFYVVDGADMPELGAAFAIVPPPKAKPTGRKPGKPKGAYGLDLGKPEHRAQVERAWEDGMRTLPALADAVGVKADTLRKAIERGGFDVDTYIRTGALRAKDA